MNFINNNDLFLYGTQTAHLNSFKFADEQQAQNNSMEQDVETNREGGAAPLVRNPSIEPHADDSDDSL